MIISGLLQLYTEPNVQNTTSATFVESAKYSIMATSPPKNIDIAIPANMMEVALMFFLLEKARISNVGSRANINARGMTIRLVPNMMIPIQAPQAAPCEMPIVDGLASGLPSVLCSMQPQTPRTAPTSRDVNTWGNLKFEIIIAGSSQLKMFIGPKNKFIVARTSVIKITAKIIQIFLRDRRLYSPDTSMFNLICFAKIYAFCI